MRSLIPLLLLGACSSPPGVADVEDTDVDTSDPTVPACEGVDPVVHEITVPELVTMLETKDFELVNVHVPDEGEIPETDVHVAYTDADALEDYLDYQLDAKVVVYCKTGPMSAIASADLVERGYCNVYDLPDGMVGWEAQGNPIQ